MFTSFTDLYDVARSSKKKKLVLVAAHDQNAIEAVINAFSKGFIDVVLVGNKDKIKEIASALNHDITKFELIHEPDNERAAETAVRMVSENHADIVMKGHLETSCLLRAVLNKDWGLRSSELLSHLALFELPSYHKILGLTDAAINIAPDFKAKVSILRNAVSYLHTIGLEKPKVAVLSAIETVNPNLKSSMEAASLSKMAERGQIANCIVDGPFALDSAISKKSAVIKKLNSPVAGDADLLIGDDLDASNAMYKSFIYLGQAKCAAVIIGAKAPVVLTSRADNDEIKLNSIVLAAAVR